MASLPVSATLCLHAQAKYEDWMAQSRTGIPLFRAALAIALVWVVVWLVVGFIKFNSVRPFDLMDGYRRAQLNCRMTGFHPGANQEKTFRRPDRAEVSLCLARVDETFRRNETDEVSRVIAVTATWALVPATALLILGAVGAAIQRRREPGGEPVGPG